MFGGDADIPLSDVKTPFPVALPCASLGTFSIQQLALPLMCYTATCSVQLAEKLFVCVSQYNTRLHLCLLCPVAHQERDVFVCVYCMRACMYVMTGLRCYHTVCSLSALLPCASVFSSQLCSPLTTCLKPTTEPVRPPSMAVVIIFVCEILKCLPSEQRRALVCVLCGSM